MEPVSKQELTEDKLKRFVEAIRNHDFLYDYSDDGRAYRAGVKSQAKIDMMLKEFADSDERLGAIAKELYLVVMKERHPFMYNWTEESKMPPFEP